MDASAHDNSSLARAGGVATIVAGACYLPLALLTGWQSIADIGSPTWWFVQSLATAHHVVLLFGLIGIFSAALRRPGAGSLGAFIVASVGNVMVAGVGAIQLTVLPALASHPDAASGLDCTPFYQAATASAAAFIDAACAPWRFAALETWVIIGWTVMFAGSLWIAFEIARGGLIRRAAGFMLAAGWLIEAVAIAAPLPAAVDRLGYFVIAFAYCWIGFEIARGAAARDA